MKFSYETHHIGNVLDHVSTDDEIKLVVFEWIRKRSEIVNNVGVTSRIRVDPNRARKLILAAAHIQN